MMEGIKIIAQNKKASFEYFLEETFEAGIELVGTEVKSLRMGKCSINESYVHIYKGEVFISGMNISPYEMGNIFNRDPLRERKLLLNKREINKMIGKQKEQGFTIVPTKIYFKGRYVKVEIALAKGKKLYDKRESTAKRDADRRARIAEKGNY
ncbi:MAG: SsrA-binding protein SmpB [archaeon]|nr:SsrA-binding protein SmpB [archaeon]